VKCFLDENAGNDLQYAQLALINAKTFGVRRIFLTEKTLCQSPRSRMVYIFLAQIFYVKSGLGDKTVQKSRSNDSSASGLSPTKNNFYYTPKSKRYTKALGLSSSAEASTTLVRVPSVLENLPEASKYSDRPKHVQVTASNPVIPLPESQERIKSNQEDEQDHDKTYDLYYEFPREIPTEYQAQINIAESIAYSKFLNMNLSKHRLLFHNYAIPSLYFPIALDAIDIFQKIGDGVILLAFVDFICPDMINLQSVFHEKPTEFEHKRYNLLLLMESLKKLRCRISPTLPNDIMAGRYHF
jgi:hypothetical protein